MDNFMLEDSVDLFDLWAASGERGDTISATSSKPTGLPMAGMPLAATDTQKAQRIRGRRSVLC